MGNQQARQAPNEQGRLGDNNNDINEQAGPSPPTDPRAQWNAFNNLVQDISDHINTIPPNGLLSKDAELWTAIQGYWRQALTEAGRLHIHYYPTANQLRFIWSQEGATVEAKLRSHERIMRESRQSGHSFDDDLPKDVSTLRSTLLTLQTTLVILQQNLGNSYYATQPRTHTIRRNIGIGLAIIGGILACIGLGAFAGAALIAAGASTATVATTTTLAATGVMAAGTSTVCIRSGTRLIRSAREVEAIECSSAVGPIVQKLQQYLEISRTFDNSARNIEGPSNNIRFIPDLFVHDEAKLEQQMIQALTDIGRSLNELRDNVERCIRGRQSFEAQVDHLALNSAVGRCAESLGRRPLTSTVAATTAAAGVALAVASTHHP